MAGLVGRNHELGWQRHFVSTGSPFIGYGCLRACCRLSAFSTGNASIEPETGSKSNSELFTLFLFVRMIVEGFFISSDLFHFSHPVTY
jgi:hypothetical protein